MERTIVKRGAEGMDDTARNQCNLKKKARVARASSSDSSGNKVVVVRRGFLCFTNNREAICVNDGAEVVLVPGGPQWKAHIMQEEDASEIKLVLKHVERKDNSEERKKECVASLMNEVQRRKAEIAALTNDLTNLTNRCGESDDPESFGVEITQICAARSNHKRRIAELEDMNETEVTVTITKQTTALELPAGEVVDVSQWSSYPLSVVWCPAKRGNADDGVGTKAKVVQKTEEQQVLEKVPLDDVGGALEGRLVRKWGSDGCGDGEFQSPDGLAVDQQTGEVFVCDGDNGRIQVFSSDGSFLRSWRVQEDEEDGESKPGRPCGITFSDGDVYVTDTRNDHVYVFDVSGTLKGQCGLYGSDQGGFTDPKGIAVRNDEVFVVDSSNDRVQVIDKHGDYLRELGQGELMLDSPTGIAVSNEGEVFVCDSNNDRMVVFDVDGTYIRQWGCRGSEPGQFLWPHSVALSGDKVVISDQENHRVQVFDMEGTFVTQWGKQGDEPGQFAFPTGVAVGPAGEIYVCEKGNRRVQVFQGFK